jgi:hypothetical protein
MNKRFLKILLAVLLLLPLCYWNLNCVIAKSSWKSVSQNRISDWMDFNKGYLKLEGRLIIAGDSDEKKGVVILSLYKYLITMNNDGDFCFYARK